MYVAYVQVQHAVAGAELLGVGGVGASEPGPLQPKGTTSCIADFTDHAPPVAATELTTPVLT